jgi:hypothetical protein
MRTTGKRITIFICLALFAYVLSYACVRTALVQRWDKDGKDYVIFPKKSLFLYYAYRPVALLDGKITGMRFHIGPHEN